MHTRILAASIASLLAPSVTINHMRPTYGDDDTVVTSEVNPGSMETKVEGEQPVDFSSLGKKPEESSSPETKVETPTKEAPPAQPEKKLAEVPDPKEKEAKPPEQKPAEDKTKAPETEKKPDPKPEEKKLPENDDDLERHKLKENAPPQVQSALAAVKQAAKEARGQAREYSAKLEAATKEIETLKASALDKEAAEKIRQENEQLRKRVHILSRGEDPEFRAGWNQKITAAEEAVYAFLKSEQLNEKTLAQIKEKGIGEWDWEQYKKPLGVAGYRDLERLVLATVDLQKQEAEEIQKLTTDHETWQKEQAEASTKKREAWYGGLSKVVYDMGVKEAERYPWASELILPENATAEQKAVVEKHNAALKESEKKFTELVVKLHEQDPETFSRTIYDALSFEREQSAHKETKAEVDRLKAQVAQLESRIAGARKAGDMNPGSQAETTKSVSLPVEGDAHSAIQAYWGKK